MIEERAASVGTEMDVEGRGSDRKKRENNTKISRRRNDMAVFRSAAGIEDFAIKAK